jgi:DNA-binding NarL/FixJ family response regulator
MSALAAGIGQAADGSSDVLRLVIVDDVEDLLVLLRLQFGRDPRFLVVGEGKDGHEAISLARDLQPDLMILDRQMPNLGGLDALPQIRSAAPDMAIVVYTANADAAADRSARDAGAREVLEKGSIKGKALIDELFRLVTAPSDGDR